MDAASLHEISQMVLTVVLGIVAIGFIYFMTK